jgi:hypothetical protein
MLSFFSGSTNPMVHKADWVIRFNDIKNFGAAFGKRTDALVLINRGRPAIKLSQKEKIERKKLLHVKELWFSRPLDNSLFDMTDPLLEEQSQLIITFQGLEEKRCIFLSSQQYSDLILKLDLRAEPSSGICAIWLCQNDERFANSHFYLDGFSWTGWSGHDWEREKAYCLQLEKKGKLSII